MSVLEDTPVVPGGRDSQRACRTACDDSLILSLPPQVLHLGYGRVCLRGAHQAGVNGVPSNPALGVQQDGLHVMWPRPEVALLPRPKDSVSSTTCFQQEPPPSLNGSSRESGPCPCPLSRLQSSEALVPGLSCPQAGPAA